MQAPAAMDTTPTDRAMAIALRTYHRPLDQGGKGLETWQQVVDRVMSHQRWLWVRAKGENLTAQEEAELEEVRSLILSRRVAPAGRTLWLGGTELSRRRESSMFNCAFTNVETVYDVVDVTWLLLQGCGVGFAPITGTLNGFANAIDDVQVIRSKRTTKGGREINKETFDSESKVWTISVGDSAIAWAKSVGKLLAGKFPAKTLILDFSEIRPAGERLSGYAWTSSGDAQIATAFEKIARLLSKRSDQLLTKMDIVDIVNHIGTILSSRRSAEIALIKYGSPEWREFAYAKKEFWKDNPHRQQSNNSLVFYSKPTTDQLVEIFDIMLESGGSEPGLINMETALRRAPWCAGVNPCSEILLGNKSFCNLSEVNLAAFRACDKGNLERSLYLTARMNYRQTCVNLQDEILQEAWHLNNGFLHLCGVGLTGIVTRPDLQSYDFRRMRNIIVTAAYSMAMELHRPLPKNVTCIKPSGTLSKIMSTKEWGEVPEGIHKPLGKYVFNNVTFSKHDELVRRFLEAGYRVIDKPFEPESVLVTFPVSFDNVPFVKKTVTRKDGTVEEVEVNVETAVDQLERYREVMDSFCEQNVSCTISYDPSEIPSILDWLDRHWDEYVGVSFLLRCDPTKNAADLGYAYLPQEVVTKTKFESYVASLRPVSYSGIMSYEDMFSSDCPNGACPVK